MKVLDHFYSLLKPGWHVLDFGAGQGRQVKQMTELGMKVMAVDNKQPTEQTTSIEWKILSIQEWIVRLSENDIFDAILARNILQFFTKEKVQQELLPVLSKHLKSGGIFAIQTFYKDPEPPFERPFWSYWNEDELKANFTDWEIIVSVMHKENNPDTTGKPRDFYKTELLLRKP